MSPSATTGRKMSLRMKNRIVGMFKLARESGYTLKLIPGTPEENAPVFDVKTEKIIKPAA